jgi:hypothetical protein
MEERSEKLARATGPSRLPQRKPSCDDTARPPRTVQGRRPACRRRCGKGVGVPEGVTFPAR